MGQTKTFLLFFLAIAILLPSQTNAIKKVPASYGFLEIYGSSSIPVGSNQGFRSTKWIDIFLTTGSNPDVPASDMYNSSNSFGISYGRLSNGRRLSSFSLQYTKVEYKDSINVTFDNNLSGTFFPDPAFNISLYDLKFTMNYYFNRLDLNSFSPYLGGSGAAGLEVFSVKGFDSQSDFKTVLSFNFGAEFRIRDSNHSSDFVTLSLSGSYDLIGSSDRIKYLNLGIGLKYFFRP